jgi:hypothetical protein
MFNGAILAITREISVYRFEANLMFFPFLKMHKPFIWCLTINNVANFIDILNHLNLFRRPTSVSIYRICTCAAKTLHVELVLCSVTGCVCFVVPNVNWWGKKRIELVGDESRFLLTPCRYVAENSLDVRGISWDSFLRSV